MTSFSRTCEVHKKQYLRELLLPVYYSCLRMYIVSLDLRVIIQCTRALNARDFHLHVNH